MATLSTQLVRRYGSAFELRNLRRMVQFAELFPDLKIVSLLATQLSWSHFIEILPIVSQEARLFYAHEAATRHLGKMELRRQISRKAFERREIANSQLGEDSAMPFNVFKDPYILDTLGLKDNFLEADLDKSGIAVAEYWTNLPPKADFERKIKEILVEAQERLERRKLLPNGRMPKQLDYFYDSKDGDLEND